MNSTPATPTAADTLEALKASFGDKVQETYTTPQDGIPTAVIAAEALIEIGRFLRDNPSQRYDLLTDICSVDNTPKEPRFTVVYHLYSVPFNRRARLKVRLTEADPTVDSVTPLWRTANWEERETYDMMGIHFRGHPDLKRILMPLEYEWHPLRKEFPLQGIEPDKLYREDRGDT